MSHSRWVSLALIPIAAFAFAQDGPKADLHWEIKVHPEVYGFNVYRSNDRTGPFVRVNDELVRDGETENADGNLRTFNFTDTNVISGTTYYYYVDMVKTSGVSERLTGTLAKKIP